MGKNGAGEKNGRTEDALVGSIYIYMYILKTRKNRGQLDKHKNVCAFQR